MLISPNIGTAGYVQVEERYAEMKTVSLNCYEKSKDHVRYEACAIIIQIIATS